MKSKEMAWDYRIQCMDHPSEECRAPFLAAADLLAVLAEEKIPVRISLGYRAKRWMNLLGISLQTSNEGWLLSEDQEWRDPSLWDSYSEPTGRILIDYHRSIALKSPQARPFAEKWKALGYKVEELDGHDHERLHQALKKAEEKGHVFIVHTRLT